MDALPNTTAGPPAPTVAPALTRRQEAYARCLATGMSYAEAFRQAGCLASTSGSMSRQIAELNRTPKVAARIRELRIKADEQVVSTIAERMSWLRLIITADPEELSRLVHDPCDLCWPEDEIARAYSAHFMPTPFDEHRAPLPNLMKPRNDCRRCHGEGVGRVVLTPTDELSPAGRALFKGASQDKDGVITVHKHDQIAAAEMLNKLQSAYVTKSLNLNANIAVPAARDAASAGDALALFEAFAP